MKSGLAAPFGLSEKHRRFVLFLVAGGFAALVNVVSRVLLSLVLSYEIAVAVAYLFGMTTAYVLNKVFVFEKSGRAVHHEYLRFAAVNAVAIVQVWVVSVGLARYVFPWLGFEWHADTIAHMIGVVIPIFTSYVGHKKFSFAVKR